MHRTWPRRGAEPVETRLAQFSRSLGDDLRVPGRRYPRQYEAVFAGVARNDVQWKWNTVCHAAAPHAFRRLTPSAPSRSRARRAISWARSAAVRPGPSASISIRSAAWALRDHQRVPPGRGVDVHEGERPLGLGDLLGRQVAGDDGAEDAGHGPEHRLCAMAEPLKNQFGAASGRADRGHPACGSPRLHRRVPRRLRGPRTHGPRPTGRGRDAPSISTPTRPPPSGRCMRPFGSRARARHGGVLLQPALEFIATYGLPAFEESMAAMYDLTRCSPPSSASGRSSWSTPRRWIGCGSGPRPRRARAAPGQRGHPAAAAVGRHGCRPSAPIPSR